MTVKPPEPRCTKDHPCGPCLAHDEERCIDVVTLEDRALEAERLAKARAATTVVRARPPAVTAHLRQSALAAFMTPPSHPRTT